MQLIYRPLICWLRVAGVLSILCLLSVGQVNGSAAQGSITVGSMGQFASGSYPSELVYGPQSAFWFTLLEANAIASFTPPSTINTIPSLTSAARLFDLTIGPDKNLWFTEQAGNKIGRLNALGEITEFPLSTEGAYPSQIALGQEGGLWFTEFEGNKIGRIASDGNITEYELPNLNSKPLGIASALDGSLWFTEWNGFRLGKLTPQGILTEYPVPNPSFHPTEIIVGPDGNLWFGYEIGKKVVRVDPATGAMTAFNLATQSSALTDLAIGPDGKLWFLGVQTLGEFDVAPAGPANLEETPIQAVFEGQGRSQMIAGPGPEMVFITMNSQDIYTATVSTVERHDLQLFLTALPPMVFAAGEFELQAEVVNWSDSPATDVQIDLALDESMQFVSADIPGSSCSEASGHVICLVSSLAAGGWLPIRFTLETQRVSGYVVDRELALEARSSGGDYLPANNRIFRFMKIQRSFDYFNDFSTGADDHWSNQTTSNPDGDLVYLGPFDNDLVTLTFRDLPPHDRLWLCFDLYVVGAWDGNQIVEPGSHEIPPPVIGPDIWAYYVDLERMLTTTFSNRDNFLQAYPANYLLGEYPARMNAKASGDFDGNPATLDARYFFCQKLVHTDSVFTATFYGVNLDPLTQEGWALDNVKVQIFYDDVFDWLYLPDVIN
jgi:virginiamycin B lyase